MNYYRATQIISIAIIIAQAAIAVGMWSLNPFMIKSQQTFALFIGASLMMYACVIYMYLGRGGVFDFDMQWVAAGIGAAALLIGLIFVI